jgi:hypothetical protein
MSRNFYYIQTRQHPVGTTSSPSGSAVWVDCAAPGCDRRDAVDGRGVLNAPVSEIEEAFTSHGWKLGPKAPAVGALCPRHAAEADRAAQGEPRSLLYGLEGAEYMQSDPRDVWERWWDDGGEGITTIEEWTTADFGGFVRSADVMAENEAEWACDDIGMDGASEAILRAASDPDVIAAFEVARQTLINRVTGWSFSDKLRRTGKMTTVSSTAGQPEPFIEWSEVRPGVD